MRMTPHPEKELVTPPNGLSKRLQSEDSTPTPWKRPCFRPRCQDGWKLAEAMPGFPAGTALDPGDDAFVIGNKALGQLDGQDCILQRAGDTEEDEVEGSSDAGSVALSEGLERLLWSDDEEPPERAKQGIACDSLVPVPQLTTETLRRLPSLTLAIQDAPQAPEKLPDSLELAPVVAYGRSRKRGGDSIKTIQAVQASSLPPLALPPPEPLTALPPLSVLLEAGRASFRAAREAASRAAPEVPAPSAWLYPSRPYPSHAWQWDSPDPSPRQGDPGFLNYARSALERFRTSGEEAEALKGSDAMPLQRYQLRVAFLLHPLSPLSRLLVVHATGSGKTRTVLAAADSFYRSGKATCLFFPEEAVKENFYQEILKFPGAWRDFFCACCDVPNWRQRRHRSWWPEEVAQYSPAEVEACLGMERKIRLGCIAGSFIEEWSRLHPDVPPPLAPLRAFKYTAAGGSRGGWKRNGEFEPSRMDSVFRFGFDGKNPMSNKNLVFDEVHNMLALPRWKGNYWKEPLRRLRKAVASCHGSTLVFLTGSPVQTDAEDGQRLLRVLKGKEHSDKGPEGWLDVHMERPAEHFPKVYPQGVPDRPLCPELESELVTQVELPEEMETKYLEVESQGADIVRLRDQCNLAVHHSWALRPQKRPLTIEAAEQHCRKLLEVAKALWSKGEKAMAAVSRRGGLQVLKELLRRHAPDEEVKIAVFSGHCSCVVSKTGEVRVEPAEALRRFNDVKQAEVRVLLLDTAFGREGLSALGVGQLHLVDVPGSWAEYKQTVGRAIRFGDVKKGSRRSLQVYLWAARLPRDESADEVLLAQLRDQGAELCAAEEALAAWSITQVTRT
ncbi:unnamed protein product [Effrenium voratum]|uniref:Helicase C-terminal domain-containing protein n=1 Tax=Effrenium voratum TaxID=2562239 RepID=A0AA36JQZ4_9DINO|nr:unnamed protein product [Effrenium voratum]CAJ1427992.1 unnamed protein product [Effrenium voratum]